MSSGAFERAVLLGLGGSGSHMWTSLTPFTTSLPPSSPQSLTSQLAGEISEIGYGRSLLESSLTYRKTWENHTSFVWSDTIHHIATVGASKHNITTCWMDTQNGSGWSLLESSLTVVFVYFVCLFDLTPFTTSPPSSPPSLTLQLAGWWDIDWLWFS